MLSLRVLSLCSSRPELWKQKTGKRLERAVKLETAKPDIHFYCLSLFKQKTGMAEPCRLCK